MAIAASALGRVVSKYWGSDTELVLRLRAEGLVRESVSDEEITATFRAARDEHDRKPAGQRMFNSPNERVRVFLGPYLTEKGQKWAVPLRSLDEMPDWLI